MIEIGIEEVDGRLEELLERARTGEYVFITERGEPVAELAPLRPERWRIVKLALEGKIEWNGGKPEPPKQGIIIRGEPLSDTIIRARR
jgi:prevent-host-death family protein